jgi:hypothetical protein
LRILLRSAEDMANVIYSKIHGVSDPRFDPTSSGARTKSPLRSVSRNCLNHQNSMNSDRL